MSELEPVHIPDAVRTAVLEHPLLPAEDVGAVTRFLTWCEGYAALERAVLGDLSYDLPVHQAKVTGGPDLQLRNEAIAVAQLAWRLLDRRPPIHDLRRALEEHGARVFGMPLSDEMLGLFFFAGETAPAFLINSRLTPGAARLALAHLYGHYLVDNNPYTPEICRPDYGDEHQKEVRAGYFAEELLLPEETLDPMLDAGAGVEVLAQVFELPPSIIADRLLALGHPASERHHTDRWQGGGELELPERMLRLALEGMHQDRLTVDEFATALSLTQNGAIGLLRLSSSPDAPAADGSNDEGSAPSNGA
jgi:Zn-dependent peptidase ImmA (M78 family)